MSESNSQNNVREFTKIFRDFIKISEEHPSKHKPNRLRTYGREACNIIDRQAQTIKDQAAEIKDVIKFKDEIIKALNKRLSDLGAQC